ncbi:Transposable element Tcb1 transposase, partial [Cucumispora dikerogammari]
MYLTPKEKTRAEIIGMAKAEKQNRDISIILGVPYSTVTRIVAKWKKTSTIVRKSGSGRRRSLGPADIELIDREITNNPRLSTSKLAGLLSKHKGKSVCRETIRRYLHKMKLISATAAVKPLLKPVHIKKRLEKCEEWSRWPMNKWKRVVFSDESKFNLFNGDGKIKVWRKAGERYEMKNCVPSVKHGGGGVMVWGCIGYNGVGKLTVVDGTIDSIKYTRILSSCLDESIEQLEILGDPIFQQDNAPCHTSKYTMKFFESNSIKVMEWPAQSPDLNPIENLWSYIDKELQKVVIKNKNQLIEKLNEIWINVPKTFIRKLYLSIPKRIEMVIRNKG